MPLPQKTTQKPSETPQEAQDALPITEPALTPSHATAKPTEPAYADEDRVCVTFGYGANDLNSQGFMVDGQRFGKDRIARNVPYAWARANQKVFGSGVLRIHSNDATLPQIAKACGVRAGDPAKVAAMLLASDLDKVVADMTQEDIVSLTAALQRRVQSRQH